MELFVTKVMVIWIPLLNHRITGIGGLTYLNMSVHYLKIEVAKYICSLLKIFKIAHQTTQQSHDLITEYK